MLSSASIITFGLLFATALTAPIASHSAIEVAPVVNDVLSRPASSTVVQPATKGLVPALSELLGGGDSTIVSRSAQTKGLVPALSELLGGGDASTAVADVSDSSIVDDIEVVA